MKTIYIGTALTHAPIEHTRFIESVKIKLKQKYNILDFVGLVKGTPTDVYHWDIKCVRDCDAFIAECSYPAIGLGFELGIATEINKPTLALAREDVHVTRLIKGIDAPMYKFRTYKSEAGFIELIENFLVQT